MGEFLEKYWLRTAVVLTVASAIALVWSTLRIAEIPWADAWPWILFGIGALSAFGALVVQSYAPPGPNLIERAMRTDAEPILVIAGIGIAGLGTAFWFDFGDDDSGRPSDWWIVLVAAGIVLLLIGVLRTFAKSGDNDDDWLDEVANLVSRTHRAAEVAVETVRTVQSRGAASAPTSVASMQALADRATAKAADARELEADAKRLSGSQQELLRRLRKLALDAEEDHKSVLARRKNLEARESGAVADGGGGVVSGVES